MLPLDNYSLDMIELAMETLLDVDEEGNVISVRGEFSLDSLLEFWSVPGEYIEEDDIYVRTTPRYSERDLIQALINEVRRLRC